MNLYLNKNVRCLISAFCDVLVMGLIGFALWYLISLTSYPLAVYSVTIIVCAVGVLLFYESIYKKSFALFALLAIPFLGVGIVVFFSVEGLVLKLVHGNVDSRKNGYRSAQNLAEEKFADFAKVSEYVDYCTNFPLLFADETLFLADATQFLNSIIASISCAKEYVLLEFYIVKHSQILCQFLSAIYSALERGVKVQLAVDYFGSGNFSKSEIGKELINAGAKIVVYKPLTFFIGMNFNTRTHRKIAVIDGEVGYLGGVNFGNEKNRPSKDGGLRLKGDGVRQLENMIYRLEGGSTGAKFSTDYLGKGFIQPFSVNGKKNLEKIFWALLHLAKKQVVISTPYFSFSDETKAIFEYLLSTGVEVVLLLPKKVSAPIWQINNYFAESLYKLGAKVYFYKPKFLHQKMIVIDEIYSYIGSANFDLRSFEYQIESGAIICDNSVIDEFLLDFNISLGESELADDSTFKTNIFGKLKRKILSLFAYFV